MSSLAAGPPPQSDTVETPSGKGRGDENFPVGSWLIRRDLRPHVHAFYRFARNADDIADNPGLAADEKIRRLDRMAAILDGVLGSGQDGTARGAPGEDAPAAVAMRESLAATGVSAQHCHDVLYAFRLDARKLRYRDWDDLMGYCRYSASPVGRQLLDLHHQSPDTWPASDALCSALQVLNHLQDCGDDLRALDRVYVPMQDLGEAGCSVADLSRPALTPGLRRVLDGLLDRTDSLIAMARRLPWQVSAAGLRLESAVIVELAARLSRKLRRGDPLAGRVKLRKADFAAALILGLASGMMRRSRR